MIEIKKILVLDQAFMDSLTKKSTLLTRVGPVRGLDCKLRVSDEEMASSVRLQSKELLKLILL